MQAAADLALFSEKKVNAPVANYLTKPVSQSELLDTVVDTLDLYSRPTHRPKTETLPTRPLQPLRILLAEDLPANQKVAKAILEKRGHQVVAVPNGRVAVDCVQDDSERFDVVLMDIQMPVMDGYQATAAIRSVADPAVSRLPIIAMTAHAMQGDREACLSTGMDAYIAKPFDARNLVEVVEAIVSQPDLPAGTTLEFGSKSEFKQDSQVGQDHFELVDLEAALNRLGGDQDLFREFVVIFQEDAPKLLNRIVQSVEQQDSSQLEQAAHALKGLMSNFGANQCVELAQQLESAGKQNHVSSIAPLLKPFQLLCDKLWSELAGFTKT
jgi:CheY-like chemotaxis protein